MHSPTLDFFDTFDPLPERTLAMRAASLVGVPAEVLEAVRSAPHEAMTAAAWLEFALAVNRGWRRAA